MNYNNKNKYELLSTVGKNINYYRYHANNSKIMNEKGFVTIEKLADDINSSANMIYNLTAKNVKQGVSLIFLDKLARSLDIPLYLFFLNEQISTPPKYNYNNDNNKIKT